MPIREGPPISKIEGVEFNPKFQLSEWLAFFQTESGQVVALVLAIAVLMPLIGKLVAPPPRKPPGRDR